MNDDTRFFTKNTILNALPAKDFDRLRPSLEKIDLPHAKVLYKRNERISHVYFPNDAMVSVVAYSETGQGTEVAEIGREGAAGVAVVMGADATPYENIIQLADGGYRITTEAIRREFDRGDALQKLLLQFTNRLIIQVSQIAMCNRIHSVEHRLSRWLLMCRDRSESAILQLTQEFLAVMLGSTRTSVNVTATELQRLGYISYSRGKITILDRDGLKSFTCECYQVICDAYEQ